jgi:hypothetical protein
MTIETIALLSFVFAAAALAAAAYERRMDVLYGPYIEGRAFELAVVSTEWFLKPVRAAADSFRWKARNMAYFASAIPC